VNIPEGTAPDELTPEFANELLDRPSGDKILGTDLDTGLVIVARSGRYGPYVTEVLAEDAPASAKPRTASLLKSMDIDSVTLEQAKRLLTLPRTLGEIDGEQVTAQNGRYGPYVKKGNDSRSLDDEEQIFTLTLEQASELFAQPKQRGRARAATAVPPLRELGDDSASGKPIVLREGRWGPYVTDGETNASLRKGDAAEAITLQRAIELLAERRASGPATKRRAARPAAKTPARSGTSRSAKSQSASTRSAGSPAAKPPKSAAGKPRRSAS
jgi:DNA topoisomerase-1